MRELYSTDESRVAWQLLVFDDGNITDPIQNVELGKGNAERLIETQSFNGSSTQDCRNVLVSLCDALEKEQHSNCTLITPDRKTLMRLRTQLLSVEASTPVSLRGYSHVDITSIIQEYFNPSGLSGPESESMRASLPESQAGRYDSVEQLWNQWRRLSPLIPTEAAAGRAL